MTFSSSVRSGAILLACSFCVAPRFALAQGTTVPPTIGVTANGVTVSNAVLKWEPWSSLPVSNEYRPDAEPVPPYALTLTVHVESAEVRGGGISRVVLTSPSGRKLVGEPLRNFVGVPGDTKWMWKGRSTPEPNWSEWPLEFSVFSRTGAAAARRAQTPKDTVQWNDIPVDGAVDSETVLGRAKTEQTGASGEKLWLESIKIKKDTKGNARMSLFGRWTPPPTDPAMQLKIDVARGPRDGTQGFAFDAGESERLPTISNGRMDGHSGVYELPDWFSLQVPRPDEAHKATLKVDLRATSPLIVPAQSSNTIQMKAAPPSVPAATGQAPQPVAVKTLGKGQLQLFAAQLKPENGAKWSWRAPLFLTLPPEANDGSQWEDTGEFFGNMSTGLRERPSWKLDGTPLSQGEVARDAIYDWSEVPGKTPPTQADLRTEWDRIKTEVFTPQFAAIPVPAPGVILTPNLSQPLGEWGTLVLRKVAAYGPEQALTPRMKERSASMFPLGGVALVFEQVPAAGKSDSWDLERNYASWSIMLDKSQDSNKYPVSRVSDSPDGRRVPSRDDLSTDETAPDKERRITLYVLPPTPGAKTFDVTVRVRHRATLEHQEVTFPAVALPAQ